MIAKVVSFQEASDAEKQVIREQRKDASRIADHIFAVVSDEHRGSTIFAIGMVLTGLSVLADMSDEVWEEYKGILDSDRKTAQEVMEKCKAKGMFQ